MEVCHAFAGRVPCRYVCKNRYYMNKSSEYQLERLFAQSGPFFHLYTSPLENDVLMDCDEDRTVILNMIALVSREVNLEVLAYALMSNHLHIIFKGAVLNGNAFFDLLVKRLKRYLSGKGKAKCISKVCCGIQAITTLKQFRDEIAYVIRNPFVVRDDINLFAYQWCSGFLYFNSLLSFRNGIPAAELSYRDRRRITRSADMVLPEGLWVSGDLILPESFVNYRLVESLFGSARKFLFWVLKNIEAQVELANMYGESASVSDDEMFLLSRQMCERQFGVKTPQELPESQQKELAVLLRNRYHASNGQLCRLTGLSKSKVDTLYPLSAK